MERKPNVKRAIKFLITLYILATSRYRLMTVKLVDFCYWKRKRRFPEPNCTLQSDRGCHFCGDCSEIMKAHVVSPARAHAIYIFNLTFL